MGTFRFFPDLGSIGFPWSEWRTSDWANSLRRVGYWRSEFYESSLEPHPADLVDPEWDRTERETIVDYLLRGLELAALNGSAYCRLCDPDAAVGDNGSHEFTDGAWVWPEGFSHYVEVHDVRPPAEFIAWALTHQEEARARPRQIVQKPERGRQRAIVTQIAIDELLAEARFVRVTEGTGGTASRGQSALLATMRAERAGQPSDPWWSPPAPITGRTGGRPEIEELARVLRIRESPHRRRLIADEDGRTWV